MEKDYINILEQSLRKKIEILKKIYQLSQKQSDLFKNPELTPEELQENVDEKAAYIDELDKLDEGFDMLYAKVQDELVDNKEKYKTSIIAMKGYIRDITTLSMDIQMIEARNKELAMRKFDAVKTQVKQLRSSKSVIDQYHKNMNRVNYIDPQFMDNKK